MITHKLQKPKVSLEDYIKIESENEEKYEFHDGEIFAMAGGSFNHNKISYNIQKAFDLTFEKKGKNCEPFNSDTKVAIEVLNKYLYPDCSVVCGNLEKSDVFFDALKNPKIVVEVLSDNTENYNRNAKFDFYKKIESLAEYVLISQDKVQVDIFKRAPTFWQFKRYSEINELVEFESVEVSIEMAAIYNKVKFETT